MRIEAKLFVHTSFDEHQAKAYLTNRRYREIQELTGISMGLIRKPLKDIVSTAVIAPGNSYGVMTGGFDQGLVDAFGDELQYRVYDAIERRHLGELNVGAAEVVAIEGKSIRYCAYAPTMRVPMPLYSDSDAPYLATRAGLVALMRDERLARLEKISVLIPLMGVGTGGLNIQYVCNQIHLAVASVAPNRPMKINRDLEYGSKLDKIIRWDVVEQTRSFQSKQR